jgi:hypothetical protein
MVGVVVAATLGMLVSMPIALCPPPRPHPASVESRQTATQDHEMSLRI